jgi:hypothetical protein
MEAIAGHFHTIDDLRIIKNILYFLSTFFIFENSEPKEELKE